MAEVCMTIDASSANYNFKVTLASKSYSFSRTHLEIDRLYAYLRRTNPQYIIPAYPPISNDKQFLIKHISLFLNRILDNPKLAESQTLNDFLESEFQYCPSSPPSNMSSTSSAQAAVRSKGFFESIIGRNHVPDNDYYFEQAHKITTLLDTGLVALGKSCEGLAKSEKLFSMAYCDVATMYTALPIAFPAFGGLIGKLNKCLKLNEDIHANNAWYLASTFFDSCCYQSRASFSALSTLDHRLDVLSDYDTNCRATAKKVAALERLKNSSNIKAEKVDAATTDLIEVKRIENTSKETLKKCADVVKIEYQRYDAVRDDEMNEHLDAYVAKQLQVHKNILKVWQALAHDLDNLQVK